VSDPTNPGEHPVRTSDDARLRAFWSGAVRLAHVVLVAGGLGLYGALDNGRAAALGFLLGGTVSILRFRLRYRAMLRSMDAGGLVRVRLVTYALNAVALVPAFGWPHTCWPWSTVAGLLLMNACVVLTELRRGNGSTREDRSAAEEGA